MKLALLALSFVLFALSTNLPLAFSQPDQVQDMNGKPVYSGGRYYIIAGQRGGIKLGETGNSTCPVSVLQKNSESMPVTITLVEYGVWPGNITTITPIQIAVFEMPRCATSPIWVVVNGDDDFPGGWVGIGGARDHPRKQIFMGRFYIRKYYQGVWRASNYYKFMFCYNNTSPPSCYDIGIGDGRRLVLTYSDPIQVRFAERSPTV